MTCTYTKKRENSKKSFTFSCISACFYIVTMNYTKKRENSIFHVFLYNLWWLYRSMHLYKKTWITQKFSKKAKIKPYFIFHVLLYNSWWLYRSMLIYKKTWKLDLCYCGDQIRPQWDFIQFPGRGICFHVYMSNIWIIHKTDVGKREIQIKTF